MNKPLPPEALRAWKAWIEDFTGDRDSTLADDRFAEEAFCCGWEIGRSEFANAADEAEHARKRGTKIRESFLASVRANVNLLASMTAEERLRVLRLHGTYKFRTEHEDPDTYSRRQARALMVETWGQEAVDAALGGDK